jgi:cbb3-type cytochrome oxidase maturation protein
MNILILMIPVSLLLGAGFLAAFIWGVRTGQNDDLITPAFRILEDDKGDSSD